MFSSLTLSTLLKLLPYLLGAVVVLTIGGYVWYLREENSTLTAQKLSLVSELSQAVDANRTNLETISKLHKDAIDQSLVTNKQIKQSEVNDKANDEAKKILNSDPSSSEHMSPYIGNVFDRLRSIQQSEDTGPN